MTKKTTKTTKRFTSAVLAGVMTVIIAVTAFAANITADDAREAAIKHAGFSAADVVFEKTEYEIDNGIEYYEVEFRKGIHEYDYTINAVTGAIVSFEHDGAESVIVNGNPIGADRAAEIAIEHSGCNASDVTIMENNLDSDDGVAVYDIVFWANGFEYEYEINAVTGSVVDFSAEKQTGANNTVIAKLVQLIEKLINFLENFFKFK